MKIRVGALPWKPASGTLRQEAEHGEVPGSSLRGIRRFRLTLLFAVSAVVLMAVATIVANRIIGDAARDNLIRIAEENTARDAGHLQSMMRTGQHFFHSVLSGDNSESGNMMGVMQKPLPLTLEFLLGPTGLPGNFNALVEGLNIVKFDLIDLGGTVLWSSDPAMVGERVATIRYQATAGGRPSSTLSRDLDLVEPDGSGSRMDVVETYLPLQEAPSGPIIGSMAISRDVSSDVGVQIDEARATVLRTMVATMGGLFFVLLGFIVVADVSIFRSNQREMAVVEEANYRLEDRVRQRTEELEEASRSLVEAQDHLITSEKLAAIGQLAGSVAHDLRNPLGAIKNAVYYLRRKLDSSDVAISNPRIGQFLQIMDDEIGRSNGIISDLLTFGRAKEPTLLLTRIADVIENTLSTTEIRDDVRVTRRFDPDLPEVPADGEQLQRVFTNLAANAQDAMPDGGELAIEMRVVEGVVEVSFSDTGIGIDAGNLQKIFEPLFTDKPEGTGLGLSICQQIVSKHGGTIEAVSTRGEGSTFTVGLPVEGAAGTEVPL